MLFILSLCIVFFASPIYAHLCLLGPATQRGGPPPKEFGPGTHECFKNVGPCGQMPSEDPNAALPGGVEFPFFIQQNLNHYSVGNRGFLDWAISLQADPQTDEDFNILGSISDYDAFHQWTQTNFTLKMTLPNVDCDHAVLRVRYVSHKPTEPLAFHQCADIKIKKSSLDDDTITTAAPIPAQNMKPRDPQLVHTSTPKKTTAAGASTAASSVYAMTDGTDPYGNVYTSLDVWDLSTGLVSQNIVTFQDYPVDSNEQLSAQFTADVVAAQDADMNINYYLQGIIRQPNDTVAQYSLLTVDNESGKTINTDLSSVSFPISAMHAGDSSHQKLFLLGFTPYNESEYMLTTGTFLPNTGLFQITFNTSFLGPFVDYAWSQYDSNKNTMHVLLRHEDEPTTIPTRIYSLFIDSGEYTVTNVDPEHLLSSFVVDASKPNILWAMSPGGVDDNGDINDPIWHLVQIDLTSSTFTTIIKAPDSVNVGPVFWSGGVFGYLENDFVFLVSNVQYTTSSNHKNIPTNSMALRITPDSDPSQAMIEVVGTVPYLHNAIHIQQ